MDKETRNEYIRRTYQTVDDCTMTELAEVYSLSHSTVSDIINQNPSIDTGGKPEKFKN